MAFLDELAAYITSLGLAATPPVQGGVAALRKNEIDEAADFEVSLQQTGGVGQVRTHSHPGVAFQNQTVQVVVRSANQDQANTRAQELWNAFDGKLRNTHLLGTYYLGLDVEGPVFFLQRDENQRFYFAFNARAQKVPS